MSFRALMAGAAGLVLSVSVSAQELETHEQRFSYTMGYQMGLSLQRPGVDLDQEALVQALRDALSGTAPRLSQSEMNAAISEQNRIMQSQRQEKATTNLARGQEFLEENKQRDAVKETDSGLQYEILEEGEGAQPGAADTVVVHYEGSLIDGSVFDSSYERDTPATLPLNGVIPGWQEGLQLMKEGAKYKFYIPAELGYGESGAGSRIGPNEALVFEVELLEIK